MSFPLTYNGSVYIIPTPNEVGWGTNLDDFFTAIAAGSLQKTGGLFTLSAETDFGSSFGLKSLYYKSRTSNVASTGILRLANNTDAISWRNAANSGDLPLTVNASNELLYNGNQVLTGSGPASYVSSITGTANQVIASASTGPVTLSLPQSINSTANVQFGTLGLGAANATSAIMTLTSTALGFLPPRMTTTQRNAIATPATGLFIYNTTTSHFEYYDGTQWVSLASLTNIFPGNFYIAGTRPWADVRAYGAVGDGTTDDLAAIQAAIEAVFTAGGGDVYFPQGNYAISNQILVHSRVRLIGQGMNSSIITCRTGFPAGRDCIHFGPNDTQNYTETGGGEYIEVRELRLVCTNMPTGVGYGIAAFGVDFTTIDHVAIYDTQSYGIIVSGTDATTNMKNPIVQYCYFNNCGINGGGDSLGGGNNQDARYLFNVFENCNGTAIDNVNVTRALWYGNHSIGNTHGKGSIWSDFSMTNSVISHNFIDNGSIHVYGLLGGGLAGSPASVEISYNTIVNASSGAILVSAANQLPTDTGKVLDLKVIGNTVDGCDDVAINLGDCPGAVVSDNVIRNWDVLNAGWEGIRLDNGVVSTIGSTRCLVSGNKLTSGNSTLWFRESSSNGQAAQNQIYGNSAIGCTATLLATAPVSTLQSADAGTFVYNQSQQAPYFVTASSNPASVGILRVASGDTAVSFRNNANTANISINKDTSDVLRWDGGAIVNSIIGTANQIIATPSGNSVTLSTPQNIGTGSSPSFSSLTLSSLTNQLVLGTTNTTTISASAPASSRIYTLPDAGGAANFLLSGWGQIVNADINASAAINVTKLSALTSSKAVSTNGSGVLTTGLTTATELDYVSGVTSAIQTQINTKAPLASPTFTGTVTLPTTNASGTFTMNNAFQLFDTLFFKTDGSAFIKSADQTKSIAVQNAGLTLTGPTTVSGNLSFSSTSTQGIVGSTTNDSAATGNVGQYIESVVSTATSAPASGTYGDATSISLTAGDWDVTVVIDLIRNGATMTAFNFAAGISTTSGNSTSGLVPGSNLAIMQPSSTEFLTFGEVTISIPAYRVSLSTTTTHYAKITPGTYSAGTPQFKCRLSARRVR